MEKTIRIPFVARILILRQFLWGAAFYGTYVLLTKYFLQELNYSEADTIMMLGAFGAVGPVFSAVGGWAADRYIGSFRAVYIGYAIYTLGFGLLGSAASTYNVGMSIFAIALIGYARGLSSTSPTVLLGNSFKNETNEAFQQGLTFNYSINNLGSFIAKYIFPFILVYISYNGNFFISCISISLTLVLFFLFRKQLVEVGNDIDKRPVPMQHWAIFIVGSLAMLGVVYFMFSNLDMGKNILYALGAMALIYFCFEIKKAAPYFRYRMLAVLVMLVILICYYFYYGQMLTSMNMYAINMMDDSLFGIIPIKPESNAAFNPLWVFLLGAPTMMIYGWLDKKGIEISIPSKFAAAFIASAIAFAILGLSTSSIDENGKVAADWIFWTHFFQAAGELIVGALAVGFIFKMVPKYLSAFAIGLRSITLSLSGILAAVISTKIALPKDIELTTEVVQNVYGSYFYNLAMMAVVAAIVTLMLSKVISNLIAKGDEHAEDEQVEYTDQKA